VKKDNISSAYFIFSFLIRDLSRLFMPPPEKPPVPPQMDKNQHIEN